MDTQKELSLITLNTWGGRSLYPLMKFIQTRAAATDVFCLQEVFNSEQSIIEERHPKGYIRADLFSEIANALPDHVGEFATHGDNPHRMSLAMFVRKDLVLKGAIAHFPVHVPEQPVETGDRVFSARQIQYATVELNGRDVLIANFHGLFNDGPKTDTPERILQSQRVKAFLDKHGGPKLLCGDFNLLPSTESLAIMAKGLNDLGSISRITGTRTPLYRHFNNVDEPNFADYMLLSPELKVQHFELLPDIVSDHAPLLVTFK